MPFSVPDDATAIHKTAWVVAVLESGGSEAKDGAKIGENEAIALSQRPVWIEAPLRAALAGIQVILTAPDPELEAFLASQGATLSHGVANSSTDAVIVVPEDTFTTGVLPAVSPADWSALFNHVCAGGRAVVLRQTAAPEEIDEFPVIQRNKNTADFLFAEARTRVPSLQDPNGLGPALVYAVVEDALRAGDRVLLWGYPDSSGVRAVAVVERSLGDGTLVVCEVELSDRLGPSAPNCDPVCQNLAVALIRSEKQ
jgi:hypothetical protein